MPSRPNSDERARIQPPIASTSRAVTENVTRRRRRALPRRTSRRRETNRSLRTTLAGGRAILDLLEFSDEANLRFELDPGLFLDAALDAPDQGVDVVGGRRLRRDDEVR